MNNNELVSAISSKLNISKVEIDQMLEATVLICTNQLKNGTTIGFQSFGNFEVRKKEERLSVHPATQIRTLIPPKLVVNFKQSNVLKDKLNEI